MVKRRAEEQTDPADMYVYLSDMFEDLTEAVCEYLGELEHAGGPKTGQLSGDTVEDMKLWMERRKELLIKDFIQYWLVGLDDNGVTLPIYLDDTECVVEVDGNVVKIYHRAMIGYYAVEVDTYTQKVKVSEKAEWDVERGEIPHPD